MATYAIAPSSSSKQSSILTLDRDLKRTVELLTLLQERDDVSLPKDQMAQLRDVITSPFFNSVKEVYEHVYRTVDASGSADAQATATAKATVAAFAASEGQGHPRVVELEKTAEGFGFNVMGGKEQKCPIYISRIIPGGYADKLGKLRRGDQIVSVNGESLEDVNHERAIDLLKAAQGTIHLVVKYSPKVLEEMEFRFENTKSFRRGKAASSRR